MDLPVAGQFRKHLVREREKVHASFVARDLALDGPRKDHTFEALRVFGPRKAVWGDSSQEEPWRPLFPAIFRGRLA